MKGLGCLTDSCAPWWTVVAVGALLLVGGTVLVVHGADSWAVPNSVRENTYNPNRASPWTRSDNSYNPNTPSPWPNNPNPYRDVPRGTQAYEPVPTNTDWSVRHSYQPIGSE